MFAQSVSVCSSLHAGGVICGGNEASQSRSGLCAAGFREGGCSGALGCAALLAEAEPWGFEARTGRAASVRLRTRALPAMGRPRVTGRLDTASQMISFL